MESSHPPSEQEIQQLREQLSEARSQLSVAQALLEAMPHGWFVCDEKGQELMSNERFKRESDHQGLMGIASPRARDLWAEQIEKAAAGWMRISQELPSAIEEGRWSWVKAEPARLPGWGLSYVGALVDISEKVKEQRKAAAQALRAQAVLDAVSDAVLELDAYGHVQRASREAAKLLGVEEVKLKGVWVGRAVKLMGKDGKETHLEKALLQESFDAEGWRLIGSSGQLIPVEARWRRLGSGEGFQGALALRDISERAKLLERLEREAERDWLTGLLNRRGFESALREGAMKAEARGGALIMIDLDGFKQINDRMGHAAGDLILKEAARALKETLGEQAICGRLGGDELAALLVGVDQEQAHRMAIEAASAIKKAEISCKGKKVSAGASVGVFWRRHGEMFDPESALKAADEAMYRDKVERKKGQAEQADARGALE